MGRPSRPTEDALLGAREESLLGRADPGQAPPAHRDPKAPDSADRAPAAGLDRAPAALATSQLAADGLRRLRYDVGKRPFLVLVELTRACDLACVHCRAESVTEPDPAELSTAELTGVLDDLAALGTPRPIVVFTGGDPLRRPDLTHLIAYATASGFAVAVSPAGTPRASGACLAELRRAGAGTVSFSLDGSSPAVHDSLRGVDGSFAWTLAACRAALTAGLRLQINTTVNTATLADLPQTLRLVAELKASLWSVFFLVPTGRASHSLALSAAQSEDVLAFLADVASLVPLKTTEAPAYRRILLQRRGAGPQPKGGALYTELHRGLSQLAPSITAGLRRDGPPARSRPPRRPLVVGDGNGIVFVSHLGEVFPSGFLPLTVGNVRHTPLSEIYAGSPLLQALRDPSRRSGRCSRCEFAEVCGGSRAQAYARSGDPLAEDPTCAYQPPRGA